MPVKVMNTEDAPAPEKRKRQRSPNFPAVGLPEAIERLNKFMAIDGRAGAPPEIAVKHIGFTSAHGAAMSVLAALKRFGLVEDKNGRVVPTQRGIEINSLPAAHERRAKAIREAALAPSIYAELIEQYRATGLPHDETLAGELVADRGFNSNGVKDFIKGFRETLDFAGLADISVVGSKTGEEKPKFEVGNFVQWESNGILCLPEPKKVSGFSDDGQFAFVEGSKTGIPVGELIPAEAPANFTPPIQTPPSLGEFFKSAAQPGVTMKQDVFSVAEGEVVLRWPTPMSEESLQDVKDWLKIVERKISRSVAETDKAERLKVWEKLGNQA